jgi:hypothetical protein
MVAWMSGAAPTPAGGQIMPGTYDLTAMLIYAADGGSGGPDPRRETVVIVANGGGFDVTIAEITGSNLRRSNGVATTSGTQLTFAPSCPGPGDGGDSGGTMGYSATATTFSVFESGSADVRVNTYTRRTTGG